MKTHIIRLFAGLLTLSLSSGVHAQGTAFTYQGRLNVSNNPANGLYQMSFAVFNAASNGIQVSPSIFTNGVPVSNGLFTVTLDFGAGVFTGAAQWLLINVNTNGAGSYVPLSPLQPLTPAPYSLYASNAGVAGSASNLSGTLPVAQLSGAPTAATNFTGTLGGDVTGTQGATVVSRVGGQTAATVASGVIAANSATSGDTANTIVERDSSGNFFAGSVTLGGSLYLPFPAIIYSGTNTFVVEEGNTYFGLGAGNNISGGANAGFGDNALHADTTGFGNAAFGEQALQSNTSGSNNAATGWLALNNNTTGSFNMASGAMALSGNTAGYWNTANGASALQNCVAGSYNTANGYQTLFSDLIGNYNTANGVQALYYNSNGTENVASGYRALYKNLSGSYNEAYGDSALFSNTNGNFNVADGYLALQNNTSGSYNTAAGYGALQGVTSGTGNIGLGIDAGINLTTGDNNVDISNPGSSTDNDIIRIGTSGVQTATYLTGTVYIPVLNITGGSDVAEPFKMSKRDIPKGSVVVIDEEHSGQLKISEQAYDNRVAGVISGANGVNPGITLHQVNVLDGDENVALSGRVYVLADASNGAIKPGDLLTTSPTPGHAMKVTNHDRAQGAILGKAMTGLQHGDGIVLVLVTLQ